MPPRRLPQAAAAGKMGQIAPGQHGVVMIGPHAQQPGLRIAPGPVPQEQAAGKIMAKITARAEHAGRRVAN